MSFSSDMKQELCAVRPEKQCCALSELSGLYMTMGSLTLLGGGKVNAQLSGECLPACRRAYTLMSKSLKLAPKVHFVINPRFGGRRRCVLSLGAAQSPKLLRELMMTEGVEGGGFSLKATTPRLPIKRLCCAKAFLRGVMLGGGTVSNPDTAYHLELPCRDGEMRQTLAKCLQRLDLPIRFSTRDGKPYCYLKRAEHITAFLTSIGAHQSVLRLEELRLRKQLVGKLNREMNCDQYNLSRQTEAGAAQLEAIRRITDEGRLDGLPKSLREIAVARLESPDASISQLGQSMNPPIGKSAVNHRLRRLMEYAGQTNTNDSSEE